MPVQERVPENQNGAQNNLQVEGTFNAALAQTVLHLRDGRSIVLPTELLVTESNPGRHEAELATPRGVVPETMALVSEHLEVGKRTVETAKVRLHRGTETFMDTVSLDLMHVGWEVERVTVGEIVPQRPEIREEGDVTVYPLVEERLVARREFFLLEEVRVRRVATTTQYSENLELKRDTLTVERSDLTNSATKTSTDSQS